MKSCYEIAFEEWLKNKTKLSESSQYKYLTAIKGSISRRCLEYGVTKANMSFEERMMLEQQGQTMDQVIQNRMKYHGHV